MNKLLLATALFVAQPALAANDKPVWQFNNEGDPNLVYSIPESDGIVMFMSCDPAKGSATITMSETSSKVKANAKVKMTFTAGKTSVTLDGKTEANEEAGTPTAVGNTTTQSPIFAALGSADKLNVVVGSYKTDVPLKGIGPHLAKFTAACAKK